MTLNCSAETEEFRRVAVRRKVKGAAVDSLASHTGEVPFSLVFVTKAFVLIKAMIPKLNNNGGGMAQ